MVEPKWRIHMGVLLNIEFDKTYLKQMANIMSNSGYGDTEAVRWIENLK